MTDAAFDEVVMPAVATEHSFRACRDLRGVDHSRVPATGSIATKNLAAQAEFVGAWGNEPVGHVHSLISVLIAAAEDHALAICRLFEARDPNPPRDRR